LPTLNAAQTVDSTARGQEPPEKPIPQLEAMLGSLAVAAAITEAAGKAIQSVSADVLTVCCWPLVIQESGIRERASATMCKTGQGACCAAIGRA